MCWDTCATDSIIKSGQKDTEASILLCGKFYSFPHHQNRLGNMLKLLNDSSICRGIYGRYVKHKRNDPKCDSWDSQGDEKYNFYFYCFCLDFLIKNENITSKECKTKIPFEIILHAGRVTSLQSWVAKKSCYGQSHINECSISDYSSNFKGL